LWWLARSTPDGRGARTVERAVETVAPEPRPAAETMPAAVEPQSEPAPPSSAAAPRSEPRPTREATSANADELARALWVEGRVLFPEGTPADEEVFVVAKGKDFADGSDHRARVETNGTFRVAFQEKTRTGHLALEARYLYLERIQRWKADEAGTMVVLEPQLGARIAGRLVVPAGTDPATVGGAVELQRVSRTGNGSSWDEVGRREMGAELAFVYDALVPGEPSARTYELAYDGEHWVGSRSALVPVAGQTLELALELRPGVTLSGIVRDAAGRPLAAASVSAESENRREGWNQSLYRHAETTADGTFHLAGLAAGKVELSAQAEGFEPVERDLGRLEEGATQSDLVLVLGDGPAITGLVRWPDGAPAEATVELVPSTGVQWGPSWNELQARSGADGRFSFAGLAAKAYRVTAKATRKEEVEVESPLTGRPRTKKEVTQWRAELEGVAAGTRDLVLTLSTGLALDGLVSDDLGRPLEAFHVSAKRAGSEPFFVAFDQDLGKAFRDTDGSFRMEGFTAGEWEVVVTSKDHSEARERLTFPVLGAQRFALPRAVTVRGLVLDPSGAPLAGAQLATRRARESPFHFESEQGRRTDDEGRFELQRLAPGETILTASADGCAPSLPVTLALEAGTTREDVRLVLRRGGTVVGEVRGPDGAPVREQRVMVWAADFHGEGTTDARGHFEIAGIPPGEVQVSAELEQGLELSEQAQLSEGETVSVLLAAPTRVVRLLGQVRAGGEPLAEASLYAHARGGEDGQERSAASAETDAEGAFELVVPGPGRYSLSIHRWREEGGILQWNTTVEVPEVESFRCDVAIPLARISGRVTDTQGKPLAGIEVASWPEQHEDAEHGSARALTDGEGHYELRVPPGNHGVKAGSDEGFRWRGTGAGAEYAEARVTGLVLAADGHLRNVDLRLERGGILTGVVRAPDGSPAANALLWRTVDRGLELFARTDGSGHFEERGLAPGRLQLTVTATRAAAREPVQVEIVAGESRAVELTLEPAAHATLSVRQAGAPVGSELTLLDARGQLQPIHSTGKGEARLGPLVPGRYTLRAQRDGKTVERSFEIAPGGPELALELVFE
ncbi:MAG TPA: carboxypeptidase regulatory-like domain-containing protein, partial [Planctomycetota bacterium]